MRLVRTPFKPFSTPTLYSAAETTFASKVIFLSSALCYQTSETSSDMLTAVLRLPGQDGPQAGCLAARRHTGHKSAQQIVY